MHFGPRREQSRTPWRIMILLVFALAPPEVSQGGSLDDSERLPEAGAGLSEAQRGQLATARDHSPQWDEAALYPLLADVATWSQSAEAGAIVPDYLQLHASPGTFRGQRFLIEGQLGAAPDPVKRRLSRSGPWDGRLQQWFVLVNRDPDEAVVLVLFDPMPVEQLPRNGGQSVRAVARFYKVWSYVDRANQPTQYLMFVGRSVKVGKMSPGPAPGSGGSGESPTSGGGGGGWQLGVVLLVLLAAWYAFWRLRRLAVKAKPQALMLRRRERREAVDGTADEAPDEGLPADPAEALDELRRRHDQDTTPPGG